MNATHFATVSLRVLGVYCFVESLLIGRGVFSALAMPEEFASQTAQVLIGSLIPSLVLLLGGIFLLISAPKLAVRISPKSVADNTTAHWSLQEFQAVLFSAVALILFIDALPYMFRWITQLVLLADRSHAGMPAAPRLTQEGWISLVLSIIQLGVSIVLFFGGRTISTFWARMKTWSSNKEIDGRT